MVDDGGGVACCRCMCSFIFTSGLTALFIWLSLRTSGPTCSIQDIYVPTLNKSDNSPSTRNNHTLFFHLRLKNEMKDKGVNYANINMTFFYYQNQSKTLIGNYSLPGFYQGHGKKANRKNLVDVGGGTWEAEALGAVGNGSTVRFRVHLTTRVKYKILFWYTKRSSLAVGGDVEVGGDGKKTRKKGIKLKSGVPNRAVCWVRRGILAVCTIFLL